MYIKYVELEQAEKLSKGTPAGLIRALMSLWYSKRRLASCSATSIDTTNRTAVFGEGDILADENFKELVPFFLSEYCQEKFGTTVSMDKLKRELTSKCAEERSNLLKFSS